jgi:hypothetical protein
VRTLLDNASAVPDSLDEVIALCHETIEWAEAEKRTMLRVFLQTKLAECLYNKKAHAEALALARALGKEVKKLDDKQLLVFIFLLESKCHHALQHLPKSRVRHIVCFVLFFSHMLHGVFVFVFLFFCDASYAPGISDGWALDCE